MLVKLILISLIYVIVNGANLPYGKPYYDIEKADELYKEFLQTHGKSIQSKEEYLMRLEIFVKNLKKINGFNKIHENTTFGVNFLHDLTPKEMSSYLGFNGNLVKKFKTVPVDLESVGDIPESVDWRQSNKVNPVKKQFPCGSCWTFSAVAVIESRYAILHEKLLSLSEQQLVDCDKTQPRGGGCDNGGEPSVAFDYAASVGGMMLESDYPYLHKKGEGQCAFDKNKIAVKVRGGKLLDSPTEEDMAKYVATYGPISVSVFMSESMIAYTGGSILTPHDCQGPMISSHVMAIIGYGTENGTPYWLIRNSWGTTFGEEGYMRLIRGRKMCLITDYVAIADVE